MARASVALSLLLLGANVARAQTYQLVCTCPEQTPSVREALEDPLTAYGITLAGETDASAGLLRIRPHSCEAPLVLVAFEIETPDGARLAIDPRVDLSSVDASHRPRVLALWIAQHLDPSLAPPPPPVIHTPDGTSTASMASRPTVPEARIDLADPTARPSRLADVAAREASASSSSGTLPPATEDSPLASSDPFGGRVLVRGGLSGLLAMDWVPGAAGGGLDGRIALGVRGRPGIAGEATAGFAFLGNVRGLTYTELRASVGALIDVRFDPTWTTDFGIRLIATHEVLTVSGATRASYAVNDALDLRAGAFVAGRAYLYRGLSIFLEFEVNAAFATPIPNKAGVDANNVVQGAVRLGLSLD